WIPLLAECNDLFVILPPRRTAEMKIAQVQNRQPIPLRRQAWEAQCLHSLLKFESLVEGQQSKTGMLAISDGWPPQQFCQPYRFLGVAKQSGTATQQPTESDCRQQHKGDHPANCDISCEKSFRERIGVRGEQ